MRLENIKAFSHPFGNRIDLEWRNPDPVAYSGTVVMRREKTHPTTATTLDTIQIEVANINAFLFNVALSHQSDLDNGLISGGLRGEFLANDYPLSNQAGLTVLEIGNRWRITDQNTNYIISRENGDLGVYSDNLLSVEDSNLKSETVYYYTLFPYQANAEDTVFDNHNRASALASGPYDMAGQMYRLLPKIYHRYDTVLPDQSDPRVSAEDKLNGQLRRFLDLPGSQLDQLYSFAKAMLKLYDLNEIEGRLLPLLAKWVGWNTDFTREIARQRNEIGYAPAIYKRVGIIPTAEATVKRISGWETQTKEFLHNVFLSNRPERLNIWEKQLGTDGEWSQPTDPLSLNFAYEGRVTAATDGEGTLWLFYHTLRKDRWNIWYKSYREETGWTPSQPLTNNALIEKYPTAAMRGDVLCVFWSAYDEANKKWHLRYREWQDAAWSPVYALCESEFTPGNDPCFEVAENEPERKQPWAVRDGTAGFWLFWLERSSNGWQLRYNRHDGSVWQLTTPATFPLDGGVEPGVFSAPFTLSNEADTTVRVFWARQESAATTGQRRWTVAYRTKASLDVSASDWSSINLLPKPPAEDDYDDLEPAALVNTDGNIELFLSSNRGDGWSIWRTLLDVDTNNWQEAERITAEPYSQRDPLPFRTADIVRMLYRSNESLSYTSEVYRATQTTDFRYAGSTTVDVGNAQKIARRSSFDDFQGYTYDVGVNGKRTNDNRYARDTIGLFLIPDSVSDEAITRKSNIIASEVRRFLPIQVRAVFRIEQVFYDYVYTYEDPLAESQYLIGDEMVDTLLSEVYHGPAEEYTDLAGFRWLRTWQPGQPSGTLPDLSSLPPDLSFRLFWNGVEEGE
ncbi:MAG: hypothetical protein O7G31_08195 [Calditrichaeota bacterium]|nr:hypothetical protein [Calditrichota bacterium]